MLTNYLHIHLISKIMSNLDDIYQELIIDHNRRPRNYGKLDSSTHSAKGHNPLCGDEVEFYIEINENKIINIQFTGIGCAISKGSASMFTEALINKNINEVLEITSLFKKMVTKTDFNENIEKLDDLSLLSGISAYPARVKCAILSSHTIESAINNDQKIISTE
tara:strand:- start:11720 stop:12211 length:492 start_codon:yes stop_codon:yes gene_type:complete